MPNDADQGGATTSVIYPKHSAKVYSRCLTISALVHYNEQKA